MGEMFSYEEFSKLEASGVLRPVMSLASVPAPGLFFSDPYIGHEISADNHGRLFVVSHDLSEKAEPQIEFLGNFDNDQKLARLVSEFVTLRDLEVPIAVYCHHSPISPDEFPWWSALPYFYWLRTFAGYSEFPALLDTVLMSESELYRELADLLSQDYAQLESPYLVDEVTGFSELYERLKK